MESICNIPRDVYVQIGMRSGEALYVFINRTPIYTSDYKSCVYPRRSMAYEQNPNFIVSLIIRMIQVNTGVLRGWGR